jgi:hypothetical protein
MGSGFAGSHANWAGASGSIGETDGTLTNTGKAFRTGNIPGNWAGSGTAGGGHANGLALVSGASHVAATRGSGGMATAKAVKIAIRRTEKSGRQFGVSPSSDAAWVNFREEAMANGMASLRGHLYGLGSSPCGRVHEATLRDAFVTITPYLLP